MSKITKQFLLVLLSVLALSSCQEEEQKYQITGTIDLDDNIDTVLLMNYKYDTLGLAVVKDKKFSFEGKVDEPLKAQFFYNRRSSPVILENEKYTTVLTETRAYSKGGQYNDMVLGYLQTDEYAAAMQNYIDVYKKELEGVDLMDREATDKARKKMSEANRKLSVIRDKHDRNILEGDYPTLAKVFALSDNYDWDNYSLEKRLELFDSYLEELPDNEYLIYLKEGYVRMKKDEEQRAQYTVGNPFFDFTANSIDGEAIKLGDVVAKNKYTLIEFWASWCGPCRGAFPHLKKLYKKYNDKGFEIYALSLDKKEDAFRKASEEEEVPWINTVDYEAFDSAAAKEYAVTAIPFTVLVGQDGVIVGAGDDIRGFQLDDLMEELYGE